MSAGFPFADQLAVSWLVESANMIRSVGALDMLIVCVFTVSELETRSVEAYLIYEVPFVRIVTGTVYTKFGVQAEGPEPVEGSVQYKVAEQLLPDPSEQARETVTLLLVQELKV